MKKQTSSRKLLFFFSIVLVILLSAGCVNTYRDKYDLWNTPVETCIACHEKDPAFTMTDIQAHKDVYCLECHEYNPDHKQRMTQAFDGTYENLSIRYGKCLLCHPTDRYSNSGHWHHLGENASLNGRPMNCADCHKEKHALTVDAINGCDECHSDTVKNAQSMAFGHCTICHGFTRTNMFGKSRELHPYKEKPCSECHTLESRDKISDKDSFIAQLMDPHIAKTNCSVCHSAHKTEDPGAGLSCARCHKTGDMQKFAVHTIPQHISLKCQACHIPHHFGLASGTDCASCHGEGMTAVPASTITAHQNCSACHRDGNITELIPDACAKCHSAQKNKLANVPEVHRACETCHIPHQWEKSAGKACLVCHADIAQETEISAKKKCSQCHDSHSTIAKKAPDGCAKCHQKAVTAGSLSEMKKDCSLCHMSHTWSSSWDNCSTCHPSMESGLHTTHVPFGCDSCHAEHTWQPNARAVCLSCHPDYEEHMDSSMACVDCHGN